MIVDAQVHIWKANTPDRPWLPNRVAQLPEPFTIEKLVPLMDEARRRPRRHRASSPRKRGPITTAVQYVLRQ